jgi:membrane-associated protease RseP (regulator of RpoE activity)
VSQQPGLLGPLDHWPPEPQRSADWGREEFFSQSLPWSLPRLWWLNLLLLLCTTVTTTVFGYALVVSFAAGRPLDQNDIIISFYSLLRGNPHVMQGLIFSIPLLLILMAHEMGHYLVCVKRGVDATFPYFMPSPTLFGTLGAFIRIKTPIYTRRDLFDIGSAGPIAGFLMLLPFLFAGVWLSHPLHSSDQDAILIATPLALRALEYLHFGLSGSHHILLHPMAIAALAGMLLTAINLLPLGQLDGGHVVYSVFGERWHKIISTCMVGLLMVMGKFYFPWWIWAVVMFFLGRRHPLVYDTNPLNPPRRWLAFFALVIFVLSASLVPTRI